MKDAFDSFCEHAKIPVPIFSILAFLIYLVNREELYMELFLFIALGGGACTLALWLRVTWQRVASLLLSFVFFILAAIWLQMSGNPDAYPALQDRILWNACTTQEEKLDYLFYENWDHDRAVAVFTRMTPEKAVDELHAHLLFGMTTPVPDYDAVLENSSSSSGYFGLPMKSVPSPQKYLNVGRLIIALAETGFLPAEDAAALAEEYFKEYPFTRLEEGTEDWIVVKGMLKLCRYGFMNSTLMVGRKDEIPPELLEYIQQLLDAIRAR